MAPTSASVVTTMDHAELAAEQIRIENMPPRERIARAQELRHRQLLAHADREHQLGPPPPRRPRLQFTPEVALLEATSRSDYDEVANLLSEGASPNSANEDGLTPLHQCAIDNNVQLVDLLLRAGASVNATDTEQWTPLHAAACCAHRDVVNLLIQHDADMLAVNADGNMPYDICDDDATLDLIETRMADAGITQQMIDEKRAEPERRMLEDMKRLHQQGIPLDSRQLDGSTFLHMAAAWGYYDVAAFLLRCSVDPNLRDNDLWMPVHAAAWWGQPDLIELLCEYGADISAKTGEGDAPLDLAQEQTTRAVVQTMLQQEARKRRLAFGVRDSRRQSRRRKKFESPIAAGSTAGGPAAPGDKDTLGARGAIRRQSLRDRNGVSLARIEASQERSELMRSWSKEDLHGMRDDDGTGDASTSAAGGAAGQAQGGGQPGRHTSPNKRVLKGNSVQNRQKAMSPDEWLRTLGERDAAAAAAAAAADEAEAGRRSQRRASKGKRGGGGSAYELSDLRPNGDHHRRMMGNGHEPDKSVCCCTIS